MEILLNNIGLSAIDTTITITGSKSESNRLLILQQQFKNLKIANLSNSKDTQVLQNALSSDENTINIGHAGTAMRFLTAYFSSIKGKKVVLTGSQRMQERPIKILVDALIELGAEITYLKKQGFPPIQITGQYLTNNTVSLQGHVSSQYISALLLIAPSLHHGLTINLLGKVTSKPYLQMSLSLLNQMGVDTTWTNNTISIFPKRTSRTINITVESDWSSASYFYSVVALSHQGRITLSYYKETSLQGDRALANLFLNFGVTTTFTKTTIILEKNKQFKQKNQLNFNLVQTPDIAQTIAVTCLGLGISCDLTGLHTLKIKETDRLEALKIELQKFNAKVQITENSLSLKTQEFQTDTPIRIKTYDDHRMAMAFAPLSLKYPLIIEDAKVVHKSYPDFWKDFERLKTS